MGQLIYVISHDEEGCCSQYWAEDEAFEASLDKWLAKKELS